MIEIVLLGAPRGKERPRLTKAGVVYTPEKTRNYEAALKYAAQAAMAGRKPLEGPLSIDIEVALPISPSWPKKRQAAALSGEERPTKKPDWDNFAKVCDALNLVVWIDDGQVVEGHVRKIYSERPGMFIRVAPITPNVEGIFG